MRTFLAVSSFATLVLLTAGATADPARCTITKIKGKDVSIDVPVTQKIGPEIFCKTRAQSAAKQYAVDNAVCDPKNARETTFAVTVVWRVDKNEATHEVKTYCPPLAKRK
jgi:hypothetical protein